MSEKKPEMLSPSKYAEKHNVPYSTVMFWLRRGEFKQRAVKHLTPSGHYYEIQATAPLPRLPHGRPSNKSKTAKTKK